MREVMTRVYSQPDPHDDAPALLARLRKFVSLIFPEQGGASVHERQKVAERLVKSVLLLQFMDPWTFDSERLKRCSCQHGLPDGRIISSCSYYCYHRTLDPRFQQAARPA
jgi:hypothetical protein